VHAVQSTLERVEVVAHGSRRTGTSRYETFVDSRGADSPQVADSANPDVIQAGGNRRSDVLEPEQGSVVSHPSLLRVLNGSGRGRGQYEYAVPSPVRSSSSVAEPASELIASLDAAADEDAAHAPVRTVRSWAGDLLVTALSTKGPPTRPATSLGNGLTA